MTKRYVASALAIALMTLMPLSPALAEQKSPPKVPPELAERVSQFLNMKLYVYETRLVGSQKKLREMLPAHLDCQVKLEDEGIMFGAGPLVAEGQPDFPPKVGMIIVRAGSFAEAKKSRMPTHCIPVVCVPTRYDDERRVIEVENQNVGPASGYQLGGQFEQFGMGARLSDTLGRLST